MLDGQWTYRSYHNQTALIGSDAAAALALIFGEGVFAFTPQANHHFSGTLDMGAGYVLNLSGRCEPAHGPHAVAITGLGVAGTPTAGWQYDYRCQVAYAWPNAIDQIECLVGTVLRVVAHGPTSPAGVTASFIAVRQAAA